MAALHSTHSSLDKADAVELENAMPHEKDVVVKGEPENPHLENKVSLAEKSYQEIVADYAR